jgi:hypothetical protein
MGSILPGAFPRAQGWQQPAIAEVRGLCGVMLAA